MFPIILFLITSPLQAQAKFEGGERGERPNICHRAQLEACLKVNTEGLNVNRSIRQEAERNISVLQDQISRLADEEANYEAKLNNINLNLKYLELEKNFLTSSSTPKQIEFPVSVSEKQVFSLSDDATDWQERFPNNRLSLLIKKSSELSEFSQKLTAQKSEIHNKIAGYRAEMQNEIDQYAIHKTAENSYETMCRWGCREQYCHD